MLKIVAVEGKMGQTLKSKGGQAGHNQEIYEVGSPAIRYLKHIALPIQIVSMFVHYDHIACAIRFYLAKRMPFRVVVYKILINRYLWSKQKLHKYLRIYI